ncbi:MAG: hypothetical protein CVU57_22280 [Deltaproteobacteria bacterium HGW-Deltaproteobacteria-15]|nr:MAG: hypothetical protein CVU57_22280 [Deltaproteobacteria bacterium HGW-Deltaproteobacteria-15]
MKKAIVYLSIVFTVSLSIPSIAFPASSSVSLPHPKGVTVGLTFPDGGITEYVIESISGVDVQVLQFPFAPPGEYIEVSADISVTGGALDWLLVSNGNMTDWTTRVLITGTDYLDSEGSLFYLKSNRYYRVQYDYGYSYFTIKGSLIDSDGDGVLDGQDDCSGTAGGDAVDQFGCSAKQNMAKLLQLYEQLPLNGDRVYGDSALNGPYVNARMSATLYGVLGGGYWENQKARTITISYGTPFNLQSDTKGGVVCQEYQASVLTWLDNIRSSNVTMEGTKTARKYKHLLSNVDYGPVQGWAFMHKAAVIYPRSTNWRTSGRVLDPWFYQKASHYSPLTWAAIAFPADDDSNSAHQYIFPNTGAGAGNYNAPDYVRAFNNWKAKVAEKVWNFFLGCKVEPCITDLSTGKRLGHCGTAYLEQIANASLGAHPLGTDTDDKVWSCFLPEGQYRLQVKGLEADTFNLQIAPQSKGMYLYGDNPTIANGTASVTLGSSGTPGALTLHDQTTITPRVSNPFGTSSTPWLNLLLE